MFSYRQSGVRPGDPYRDVIIRFVPITEVRWDLVIPSDLVEHPTVQLILDVMQTRDLRDEIGYLPGYSPSETGKTIAAF
jgi:putative molybdopterin biosynthesis protein